MQRVMQFFGVAQQSEEEKLKSDKEHVISCFRQLCSSSLLAHESNMILHYGMDFLGKSVSLTRDELDTILVGALFNALDRSHFKYHHDNNIPKQFDETTENQIIKLFTSLEERQDYQYVTIAMRVEMQMRAFAQAVLQDKTINFNGREFSKYAEVQQIINKELTFIDDHYFERYGARDAPASPVLKMGL